MQLDFQSLINVLYPDMRVSPNLDRSAHDFTLDNLPLEAGTTDDVLPIANYLHRISDSIDPHSPTVVILAGGRGSRMEQKYNQKVLAPIDGVPALLRSVDTYRQYNFKNFI
ncbi:NTP transferase domain-containing protein, partial [bacterium]|nr:NTP transferase domain-containing protein [bacterium]